MPKPKPRPTTARELFNTGKSRRLPPDVLCRAFRRLKYVHFAAQLDHARGHGSPTILIDERDVAADHPKTSSCRLYDQGDGTLDPAPRSPRSSPRFAPGAPEARQKQQAALAPW